MKLVCFACKNSAIPSLQDAGVGGMTIIPLPCSGRVGVDHLLRAVREGADAVLVLGCLEGNCRYHIGNLEARKRVMEARDLLRRVGMDEDRVIFRNLAPNHSVRAKRIVDELITMVEKMGDNPLGVHE